jgi:serine/threonine-protein kinase
MKKVLLACTLLLAACAPTQGAASPTSTAADAPLSYVSPTAGPSLKPEGIPTATFPAPPVTQQTASLTTRLLPEDGMTQVLVPAGKVLMGGLDVFAENDELPVHEVGIQEFWLDQTEVTNGMYKLCVQAGACRPPQRLTSAKRLSYYDSPEFADYPAIQVTWGDAHAYCAWAGRRLPTEAEWERAARGDDMRNYPWGDEPPSGRYANFGNLIRDTSRVGSYAEGASPFGALDMAGNVWEWVSDFYDLDYYLTSPVSDPQGPIENHDRYERVIRGGSYQDDATSIRLSNRGYETGPNPAAAYGSPEIYGRSSLKIGFRCASDQ